VDGDAGHLCGGELGVAGQDRQSRIMAAAAAE
jgi:hypothetical protein